MDGTEKNPYPFESLVVLMSDQLVALPLHNVPPYKRPTSKKARVKYGRSSRKDWKLKYGKLDKENKSIFATFWKQLQVGNYHMDDGGAYYTTPLYLYDGNYYA
tara:strand:- start:6531 stop:6839 length:309 start_codon:yes stop_codon:yes gene_type:complete